MKIEITISGLLHDGVSWYENLPYKRHTIEVNENKSDIAISRIIKRTAGIQGVKKDQWCVSDFGPWRDGTIGVYAYIIE